MKRRIGGQIIALIDVHSPTFKSIAGQIAPLEDARYIYATLSQSAAQKVLVELPRMKLKFFVNENLQLESENFRKLVVDESQTTGTMFGLRNQLVLCAKDPVGQSLPRSRSVLIPYGTVKFATRAGQAHVTIDPGSKQNVVFYQYKVDSDLGYLAGSVSLTSRLFKIYLHALTSHCLPDPLTGRTGTEEALHELSEPATSSFEHIDAEQAHLLKLIGQLTPRREYYPNHLQSMITTHWLDLSPLAQHHAFSTTANSILKRALSLQLFNPSSFDLESYMVEFNEILLERTAQRTHIYYPADTTIRLPTITTRPGGSSQVHEGRDSRSDMWAERAYKDLPNDTD
ncbi:hypothetical protein FRC10_005235 [Ceratobasidium sp. 414]|nr:hypothetical protein FRC10_005235 [Ceratobasidium sp. 414]